MRRDIAHQVLANFHRNATELVNATPPGPPEPPIRKRHICDACGKEFSRSDTLKRHRRETHENEMANPIVCDECGLSFKRKDHLRRHLNCAHKGHVLQCKYCEKTFTTRNKLDYHTMIEHDRRFQCDLCDKRFGSSTSFKRHVAAHENSDFRCPYCLTDFETKEVANIHREVCKLTMKYPCTVCGEAFKSKSSYQHHEATHFDGKFPCHTCGIKFSFSTNLNRHIRTVHSKDPDDDVSITTQQETSVAISAPKDESTIEENKPPLNEEEVPEVGHNETIDHSVMSESDVSHHAKDDLNKFGVITGQSTQITHNRLEMQPGGQTNMAVNTDITQGSPAKDPVPSEIYGKTTSSTQIADSPRTSEEKVAYISKLHKVLRGEDYSKAVQAPTHAPTHASVGQTEGNTSLYRPTITASYPSLTASLGVAAESRMNTTTSLDSPYQRGPLPSVSIFNHRIGIPPVYGYGDFQTAEKSGALGGGLMSYTGFSPQASLTTPTSSVAASPYSHTPTHHHSNSGTDLQTSHTFSEQRAIAVPMPMSGVREGSLLGRGHADIERALQGVAQEATNFSQDQNVAQNLAYQNQLSGIYLGRSEFSQEKL